MNKLLKRLMNTPWTEVAARWMLGATFVYAAVPKVADPAAFAKIVYGYELFPNALINLIAIGVPWVELVAGTCLLLGVFPRAAALLVNVLLTFFIVVLAVNLLRGHQFDCGCFATGADDPAAVGWLLARDFFYLLLGLRVFLHPGPWRGCLYPAEAAPPLPQP